MSEYNLQANIAQWIRLQYPDTLFRSDLGGVRLTPGLAAKVCRLQDGRKWPDLFIAEPRAWYLGLFLELKRDRSEIFTKRGELRKDEHTQAQNEMLEELNRRGYFACFGCGWEEATGIISRYMELRPYELHK